MQMEALKVMKTMGLIEPLTNPALLVTSWFLFMYTNIIERIIFIHTDLLSQNKKDT